MFVVDHILQSDSPVLLKPYRSLGMGRLVWCTKLASSTHRRWWPSKRFCRIRGSRQACNLVSVIILSMAPPSPSLLIVFVITLFTWFPSLTHVSVCTESGTTDHEEVGPLQHCPITLFLLLQWREGKKNKRVMAQTTLKRAERRDGETKLT